MSWLMAAVYDRFMRGSEQACLAQWRAELLRELSGAVLEVGAGDGRRGRLKWQRRVEPVWKHLMGNCHLTRRTEAAIAAAGFEIERIQRESIRKALPIVRPSIRGIARKL